MTLRVIGVGLGRTGTSSLKLALETLLGGPCYHMREVIAQKPEHIRIWHNAALGKMPNWQTLFADYVATVGPPPAWFWPELIAAFPEALVLLSVRDSERWWDSASQTIFKTDESTTMSDEFKAMTKAVYTSLGLANRQDREAAIRVSEAHNARVREVVPSDRLLIWQVGDGWAPICEALELPVPDEPFPHTNTRAEFQARDLQG
ncbi:sulfotransferase family protein [Candidatus Entotheonella serta]|nr:sulfotransferase family protein [Candidatus Entotheonella serta]